MGDDLFTEPNDGEEEYKSKTQIKNELLALTDLGKELVDTGKAALEQIPLDPELADAIHAARNMHRKKTSFKRQLQFIGKLLRSREIEPIQNALDNIQGKQLQAKAQFHKLERLRDTLVDGGDQELQNLMNDHPNLDRQRLRQWIRQAAKEKQQNKPPKAYREIFQYLKNELEE